MVTTKDYPPELKQVGDIPHGRANRGLCLRCWRFWGGSSPLLVAILILDHGGHEMLHPASILFSSVRAQDWIKQPPKTTRNTDGTTVVPLKSVTLGCLHVCFGCIDCARPLGGNPPKIAMRTTRCIWSAQGLVLIKPSQFARGSHVSGGASTADGPTRLKPHRGCLLGLLLLVRCTLQLDLNAFEMGTPTE